MKEGGLGNLHSIQSHISVAYPFSLVAEMVKNLNCNAEDPSSIPGSGRSLEKEVATHSSILVWEIPWTEEPGGLQSMESQRAGPD